MLAPAHIPNHGKSHLLKEEEEAQMALGKQVSRFSPYVNNGGTVIGVAGADFAIVAADSRISLGYSIQTRNGCKLLELSPKCVLGSSGMQADMAVLFKTLKMRTEQYRHDHARSMSCEAVGQLLSNTLYYRRFFPYYTFNVLGGIDENGEGCIFSYDAVGSVEKTKYSASGTGSSLVYPVLDNQVGHLNLAIKPGPLSKEDAIELVRDVMTSAGERDIYTGDMVHMAIVDKNGVKRESFPLKQD